VCFYCKKPGHKQSECMARRSDNKAHVSCVTSMCNRPVESILFPVLFSDNKVKTDNPYMMPVQVFDKAKHECVVLTAYRDTGADVCVLVEGSVPAKFLTFENSNITIHGFAGEAMTAPVYSMHVECTQLSGKMNVAVVPACTKLRDNAQLLIGNDYGEVMKARNEISVSAVTRSQARQAHAAVQHTAGLSASAEFTSASDAVNDSSGVAEVDQDISNSLLNLFEGENCRQETIGLSELSSMQRNDASLQGLFKGLTNSKSYFIHSNGLLMRKYIDAKRGTGGQDAVLQIVVPLAVRGKVLYLAHSAPSSGHNGRRKTFKRVLKYFRWPGVVNDVKE
jgi:Integrase zinc binding domain/Retroviral aspartyl protease